jgi:hypothetical protein
MYTVENLFHFSVVALVLNFDKIILRDFFGRSEKIKISFGEKRGTRSERQDYSFKKS